MSSDLETIRRIRAWHEGKPVQRGAVVNVHVGAVDDVLIAAFLRMGGESRPWGIAVGTLSSGPQFFTVPEARNRDLVADMVLAAAPHFLAHFRHPEWSDDGLGGFQTQSLRQIWMPGPSHLEMLHFLAAAYARTAWDRPDVDVLRALGNLSNSLFIESQRPGQQIVMSAPAALRSAFVFPTSPAREAHLGHLLGWLQGGRSRDARWATAHAAESDSVSTVLEPEVERRDLQPLVEEWGDSRSDRTAERIGSVLRTALERRWDLTAAAIGTIRRDSRRTSESLAALVANSARAFHHGWGERVLNETAGLEPYWPNVFTDRNARSASGAFHSRVADDDEARSLLVHGDTELQREELAVGHGVIGSVVSASADQWVIEYSYPDLTTIEAGKTLTIAGRPKMKLLVDEVDLDAHRMTLTPRWKWAKAGGGPLNWSADSSKWRGVRLVFLVDSPYGLSRRKITAARRRVDDDITTLLVAPRTRHAAFDDDGAVVESVEVDQ